jgi:hypothetical protein
MGSSRWRNADGFLKLSAVEHSERRPATKDDLWASVDLALNSKSGDLESGCWGRCPRGEVIAEEAVVFSFEPRCHGECESQKYTDTPRDLTIELWRAIPLPWSQVIDLSISAGRSAIRAWNAVLRISLSRSGGCSNARTEFLSRPACVVRVPRRSRRSLSRAERATLARRLTAVPPDDPGHSRRAEVAEAISLERG